ncbi:MAG TPA: SMP-30/gluconolactonase/LRE family protein [Tepidisphaeraceae bacterium]|jgi:gluconolactonase
MTSKRPLARSLLLVPLLFGFACKSGNNAGPAQTSSKTPPTTRTVSANNTNALMVPENASGTLGTIERLDPALDALLARDAKLEILVKGLDWAEGPVWSRRDRCLYWSDVPQNVVYRWSEGKGVSVYLRPSGYTGATPRAGEPGSNGLTIDRDGRLTLCEHGDRRVARLENNGKTQTALADRFEGKRFNSPNDLCYDSKGNLYFTDPAYGLEGKLDDPKKELPFQGVYRLTPDRKLSALTKEIKFPNGVALSPDEKVLYVAESNPDHPVVWAFDLAADGTLANPRTFFDATALVAKKLKGLPDGMKVDQRGNVWLGGPGGILVLSKEGKHLGTILTGEATANCAWGDDGSTLYVTADMYLCRIKTSTRGTIPGQ